MRYSALLRVLPVLPADPASLVLAGGKVRKGNAGEPWAEVAALRGERIVAAGQTAALEAHRGPAAEVFA